MSISVQNSSAALLALQTLSRLSDSVGTDAATGTSASSASSSSTAGVSTTVASSAQGLSADALGAVTASLDRAASITDAALSAGQSVSDLLSQLKTLASGVQDGSADGDAGSDFAGLLQQISQAVSGAGFDGVNLLDGSDSGNSSVLAGGGAGGSITLAAQNLSLGGPVITVGSTASLSTATAAASVLDQVDASIANLTSALGQIGDQSQQIQAHAGFVSRLSDVLASGASDPTGGQSLSADGARLMALQIQQQLSQGGNIINAAPQVMLSLFK